MDKLTDKVTGLDPLKTALVFPVQDNSLKGAFEAASAGILAPILVGPKDVIEQVAQDSGIDISAFDIVDAADEEESALKAVELVKDGKAEALMKGNISTDKFLTPIVSKDAGLRTGRRMSHVFRMIDPDYGKPLYLTDCAVNNMRGVNLEKGNDPKQNTDLMKNVRTKKDIIANAIDLFRIVEGEEPNVALLSATEKVTPKFPCSVEAGILKDMADNGDITGGNVDGPFAIDIAVSAEAAKIKNVFSSAAGGAADILVMPELVAGNILYKGLTFLSDAKRGGIVLGAKVPVILTSRAADADTRLESAALALLNVRNGMQP